MNRNPPVTIFSTVFRAGGREAREERGEGEGSKLHAWTTIGGVHDPDGEGRPQCTGPTTPNLLASRIFYLFFCQHERRMLKKQNLRGSDSAIWRVPLDYPEMSCCHIKDVIRVYIYYFQINKLHSLLGTNFQGLGGKPRGSHLPDIAARTQNCDH